MGRQICTKISAHLSFNSVLIWAAGSASRLNHTRYKAQIHSASLFKTSFYSNRPISSRSAYVRQYSCLYINTRAHLSLWLLCWPPCWDSHWKSLPVTGAPPFRSDRPSSIVSLPRTSLSHLIEDRYGDSSCIEVPFSGTVSVWYRLSF